MSRESATLFMDLLEDEAFRDLSAAGWLMGIPAKADQAIAKFGRCVRRIVNSRLFKPLMNLTSKGISTATHLPMPDCEIGALIATKGYMPPIIPLAHLRENASASYRCAGASLLIHPSVDPRGNEWA